MSHHDEELFAVLARIALAGDGVVLGLGMGILAVRTWLKYRFHSRALKQVEGTQVTQIADLRSLVQHVEENRADKSENTQLATISSEDLAGAAATPSPPKSVVNMQASRLVIVRGRVQLSSNKGERGALVAQNGNERGVFLERTQTCFYNEWRGVFGWGCKWKGLLGWGSLKEQVAISRRKVPFVIAAGRSSSSHHDSKQVYVHIELDEQLSQPLPLVTVHREFHPVPASSHTFLQAMFGRRYLVGLLDEEKILPICKEITAVGILSSASDGNPVIRACKHLPCFLSEGTHEQLVAELATGTNVLLWTGVAVSTITAVILSYALLKNWTKWKARQQERRRRDEERRQGRIWVENELEEDITDVPDGELCVVCLLRRRRAAFIFCGHRVCCVSCAQRIDQGSSALCPVCRQSVTGYIRVFDS